MKWLAAISLLVMAGNMAQANGWSGFYTTRQKDPVVQSPNPRGVQRRVAPDAACVAAILAAQERYGIPDNILLGIGLQEAGRQLDDRLTVWPWAVNAAGEGRYFDSEAQAMAWVKDRLSKGVRSIDVGCMQINLRWHPDAFQSLAEGFDPTINADYAARFLMDLYRRTGNWAIAAGSYHSFTPAKRDRYLKSLRRNVAVANQQADAFHELAARDVAALPVKAPEPAKSGTPKTDAPGVFWSASISGTDEAGARSLYGPGPVKPILPMFQRHP